MTASVKSNTPCLIECVKTQNRLPKRHQQLVSMPLIGTLIFPYYGTGLRRADKGLRFYSFATAMADRSSYAPQERRPYDPCKIRKSHDSTDFLHALVVQSHREA